MNPPQTITGALTLLLAALAGYFSLILASPTQVVVGPVRVEFQLRPAWQGKSVVDLPPAGSIEADTHTAPARAVYTLKEITVTDIDELTDADSASRLALDNWREPVGREVTSLVWRTGLLAAVAGAAVAAVLRRRWRWALAGAVTSLVVATAIGGATFLTYDTGAFEEPRYTGNLTYAPEIIDFSQQTLANLDAYEDRVPVIAESLYVTVNELHQLPAGVPEDGTVRVLHISDMHSSEAAASLVRKVTDLYDVDFVVDTGDSTELGTVFEMDYFSSYLPLPRPYVWVAGNHDTPTVIRTLAGISGVTVLDKEFATFAGIKTGGFADLSSTSISMEIADDARQMEAAGEIAATVNDETPKPFLVAVHDPLMASLLAGRVPVVLNGHTHHEGITVQDGTVFMDAGSTGAGGFRGFEGNNESPSTLHILYITREPMKLVASDTITIFGFSQEFSVSRRVFGADEGGYTTLRSGEAIAGAGAATVAGAAATAGAAARTPILSSSL